MTKTRKIMAAVALAATVSDGGWANASPRDPFADLQWRKRIVILFAPSATTSLAEQAKDLLADRPGLAERDLLVVAVRGGADVEIIYGKVSGPVPSAEALRQRFRVPETAGFTAILVGKDGGEKLRETHPIRRDTLYAVIDAMPMRRGEAKPAEQG